MASFRRVQVDRLSQLVSRLSQTVPNHSRTVPSLALRGSEPWNFSIFLDTSFFYHTTLLHSSSGRFWVTKLLKLGVAFMASSEQCTEALDSISWCPAVFCKRLLTEVHIFLLVIFTICHPLVAVLACIQRIRMHWSSSCPCQLRSVLWLHKRPRLEQRICTPRWPVKWRMPKGRKARTSKNSWTTTWPDQQSKNKGLFANRMTCVSEVHGECVALYLDLSRRFAVMLD